MCALNDVIVPYCFNRVKILLYCKCRNGGFETSPLIGKYCGNTIDQIIRSQSNRLYLKMETDYSVAHRGFRLYYDGTTSGIACHLVIAFVFQWYIILFLGVGGSQICLL